ncbi:MAG: GerAB/ArcD/ProY family transporter [Lachnospiraceae bacterium]
MFSRNGKISQKQFRRMIMLPVFASCIFVLPFAGAVLFKGSLVWGLIIFFAFACIYVSGMCAIGCEYAKDEEVIGKVEDSSFKWKIINFSQILRQTIHLSFYIVLSIAILGEAQVPFMKGSSTNSVWNLLVVLPLVLIGLYGANRNVEKIGRLYEMLFWLIFIPFIIMILFGLKEVNYEVFIPQKEMNLWKIVICSYALLTFVIPAEQFLFLRPNIIQKETQKRQDMISFLFVVLSVGLVILLSLFILGIYGVNGASLEEMVTVDIMRYIRLPLGILERFDVLMVWFFMLGCFVLICSSLFFGGYFAEKINYGKKIFWLIGMVVVSLLLVLWLPDYRESLWMYICYGAIFDVPFSILLPVVGSIFPEKNESISGNVLDEKNDING